MSEIKRNFAVVNAASVNKGRAYLIIFVATMSKGLTIHFSVHPIPKHTGEEGQTYHVRQNIRRVIRSQEFREHISDYSLVTPGLFEMVIDYVEKEIAEQLLAGYSVHIDGLGRFSLRLGTRKVKDKAGNLRRKTYTSLLTSAPLYSSR